MKAYFFDAYALLRVYRGAPSYEPYSRLPIVTDHGCLYEFARNVVKVDGAQTARHALDALRAEAIEPTAEDMVEAAKLLRRASRLSSQDALGYSIARRAGLAFLTGDGAFRQMAGVEFVA